MEIINQSAHSRLEEIARNIGEYLDTRWEIIQLNVTERGLSAVTTLVSGLLLTLFGSIILIFAGIGTAILIGQWLENPAIGFFIMAMFMIVMMILALLFARNYIHTYITDTVLESIKDDEDETYPS
ncbi:MAG: hypothetical protein H7246_16685 [Phycisphaerae bacterium]|nr:hypothetical protein [Saprospiraceae bacterium]